MITKSELTYGEWRVIRNALMDKRRALWAAARYQEGEGCDSSAKDMRDEADTASQLLVGLGNEYP